MATSHARRANDPNLSACGACKDPRMLTDDGRYDCLRCARVLGRARSHDPAPAPALAPAGASPDADHPCVPATVYPLNGFWFAECPFLNISRYGKTADEAEAKLREHVRSLGPLANGVLRKNQRFFQLPLPE